MREITYTDKRGRNYRVELPDEASDDQVEMGIFLGPPDRVVDSLELPTHFATRLHNELERRGILTTEELKKPGQLDAALRKAYMLDVQILHQAFLDEWNIRTVPV